MLPAGTRTTPRSSTTTRTLLKADCKVTWQYSSHTRATVATCPLLTSCFCQTGTASWAMAATWWAGPIPCLQHFCRGPGSQKSHEQLLLACPLKLFSGGPFIKQALSQLPPSDALNRKASPTRLLPWRVTGVWASSSASTMTTRSPSTATQRSPSPRMCVPAMRPSDGT